MVNESNNNDANNNKRKANPTTTEAIAVRGGYIQSSLLLMSIKDPLKINQFESDNL